MSAPFIPELSLGAVETGGGWGVGEQFARLPPASVQAKSRIQIYTVGPDRGEENQKDFEDELISQDSITPATGPVPTTHYTSISADDDDTFVDHGSTVPPASPPSESPFAQRSDRITGGKVFKQTKRLTKSPELKFSLEVSRMMLAKGVRAMVTAPDGASLWAAVGDDPIAMLDFKGTQLNISRTVDVSQVYAMAVVRVQAVKAITFKSPRRVMQRKNRAAAPRNSLTTGVHSEDTYTLWCGLSRGSISIVDLSDFSLAGVIRSAHTQAITGMWCLNGGKVWTAGCDKAFKVWDPQTRCRLKSRNIATVISDICYVCSCKQVWAIGEDALIRVFDATGNNIRVAKQSHDKPENAIRMRAEMRFIAYCESADVVCASLSRGIAIIDPSTCDIIANGNASITSISFVDNMAIVTGHGELLQCEKESIALIDLSEPSAPSLIFRGAALEGTITSLGMRLFTAVPFAVAVQEVNRNDRFFTVFSYEDSNAFSRGGSFASIPEQRKVTVENSTTRRLISGGHNNVPNSGPSATPSSAHCPVVFATGIRGLIAREEASGLHSLQQRFSAVMSSRVEGGIMSSNRNNNSRISRNNGTNSITDVASNNIEQGVAVQLATPPELMASLTNIEKKTEDLKALFAHMRASRPLLDDFSKLHALVSRWAMNNQLGPALDTETMDSIERDYQTLEGRVVVAAVERLRISAAAATPLSLSSPKHTSRSKTNFTSIQGSGGDRKHVDSDRGGSGVDMETAPSGTKEFSVQQSITTDESINIGTPELQSESLLRWVAQITRSGHGERESHRRQLESLERHNTRIVERNAAFINGIARMEQALCTHAQRLLDEADAVAALSEVTSGSSNHVYNQRHIHLLNQALQQVEQLSVSSSPKKITEAMGSLITLVTRLLSAQQYAHSDERTRQMLSDSSSKKVACDYSGDATRTVNDGKALPTDRLQSPGPSATFVVALRPQRVLNVVEDQILSVEEFVKDVGKFWCCLEETQKVIYLPYEGGGRPDLFQDFMQLATLWHLREAQVMLDICKRESVVVMADVVLLDLENRDDQTDENIMGTALASTASSMVEKAVCGGGNNNTNMSSNNLLGMTRNDSARLAGISLELEAVASCIRGSLMKAVQSLPAGVSREAVGGFFLIASDTFHVDAAKFHGIMYWSRMTMHLLFECLECVEEMMFHKDEQPRAFRKDNFKAIEQQVDDWRVFLEELHADSTHLRSVILSSQGETSTTRAFTTTAGEYGGSERRSKSYGGNCSSDGSDVFGAEQSTQWIILFGLYVQCAERTDAIPALFASHNSVEALSGADFGLQALLNEIAQGVDMLRTKSAALLRYCQKIQGRFVRIIEDAVVNEGTGQMLIPMWRGGPIAERYCKGICHDMS